MARVVFYTNQELVEILVREVASGRANGGLAMNRVGRDDDFLRELQAELLRRLEAKKPEEARTTDR